MCQLSRNLKKMTIASVAAMVLAAASTAPAMDQPPQNAQQQRDWLIGHLTTDMQALGSFDAAAAAKLPSTVNSLTDNQVALLAQYYFLTRSKAEQDAYLYALQQQGSTTAQIAAAQAQIADLLAAMNQEIAACYAALAAMPQPVVYCSQVCYASVPGWCCHVGCFVPGWYFNNGCYVGPCLQIGWSGPWGIPVCKVFFDVHSHFYLGYHKFGVAVHISHSLSLAKLHAEELRKGDWHSTLAHDHLVHHAIGGRTPAGKLHVATPLHTDLHKMPDHQPTVKTKVTALVHTDAHKTPVHQPKPKIEAKHTPAPKPHVEKPASHSPKTVSHGHAAGHAHTASHASHGGGHGRK